MKLKLQDTSEFNVATSSLHALSNSMALTRSDKQSPHSSPRLTRRSITPNVSSTVSIGQTTNDIYTKVRFVIRINILFTPFTMQLIIFGVFSLFSIAINDTESINTTITKPTSTATTNIGYKQGNEQYTIACDK